MFLHLDRCREALRARLTARFHDALDAAARANIRRALTKSA